MLVNKDDQGREPGLSLSVIGSINLHLWITTISLQDYSNPSLILLTMNSRIVSYCFQGQILVEIFTLDFSFSFSVLRDFEITCFSSFRKTGTKKTEKRKPEIYFSKFLETEYLGDHLRKLLYKLLNMFLY